MTLLDHLAHGARHLPLSGRLLRLMTACTALAVAFFADAIWLTVLASAGAVGIALISSMEMHEAADDCDSFYRDEDGETGFGEAA
ncbi:hypothetical protein GCM10007147_44960 [Nocardiopsis kunsanensis]|uniref:Uncharacterized protein n=1 Tax=Nocardiopsis kunsanensis TaxID=141693 RepID=A0A918XLY3_9ACTN|nr:hypothetical protein [Nocardiopsis kunsanensis]GHD37142.1 hypothetical protein GCM10007147_44960 [Nocardiopsis kunsanensis]